MKVKEFVTKVKEIEKMNTQYELGRFCNTRKLGKIMCDCSGLIKAVMWGYPKNGKYSTNGLKDINANTMIKSCSNVSTDFSNIEQGECVWLDGHIGVYIGNGLVIESTPRWENGVQITACLNIGSKKGYNGRKWRKHGKMPWIDYATTGNKSNEEIAREVISGKWGVGAERKKALLKAGYDYETIQKLVNKLL